VQCLFDLALNYSYTTQANTTDWNFHFH